MDALLLVNGITLLVMGALAALLFWLGGGSFSFRRLIAGKDGGMSTSKFQAALWSIVALAAFVAVYVAHMLKGQYAPSIELPANLIERTHSGQHVSRVAALAPARPTQLLRAKLRQERIEEKIFGIPVDQTCAKLVQNRGVKAGSAERQRVEVVPVNPAAGCISSLLIG